MNFQKNIWTQLKNKTVEEIISALEKDGWFQDTCSGAVRVYLSPERKRVTIHYHPKKTYKQSLLKALLNDIGWSVDDMKRLKFIK
jgi:predicted RNA binding protein YcfA (HicA-like mRNA interferase family)